MQLAALIVLGVLGIGFFIMLVRDSISNFEGWASVKRDLILPIGIICGLLFLVGLAVGFSPQDLVIPVGVVGIITFLGLFFKGY